MKGDHLGSIIYTWKMWDFDFESILLIIQHEITPLFLLMFDIKHFKKTPFLINTFQIAWKTGAAMQISHRCASPRVAAKSTTPSNFQKLASLMTSPGHNELKEFVAGDNIFHFILAKFEPDLWSRHSLMLHQSFFFNYHFLIILLCISWQAPWSWLFVTHPKFWKRWSHDSTNSAQLAGDNKWINAWIQVLFGRNTNENKLLEWMSWFVRNRCVSAHLRGWMIN